MSVEKRGRGSTKEGEEGEVVRGRSVEPELRQHAADLLDRLLVVRQSPTRLVLAEVEALRAVPERSRLASDLLELLVEGRVRGALEGGFVVREAVGLWNGGGEGGRVGVGVSGSGRVGLRAKNG